MRAKLILIVALMMGVVTTVLFFKYMKQFDEAAIVNETMVEVAAVKFSIERNQLISPGMVQLIQVPSAGVHPQAVRSLTEVEGKFADAKLEPGEVVLSHRVKSTKDESEMVSRKLQEGYRAVSVGVNMVQSVSNLIEPEDTVDVVFIPPSIANEPPPAAIVLLQNVRVLAVGRRMIETSNEAPYAEYSSVTLEIKPQEIAKLIQSDEQGTISLALHGRISNAAAATGNQVKK